MENKMYRVEYVSRSFVRDDEYHTVEMTGEELEKYRVFCHGLYWKSEEIVHVEPIEDSANDVSDFTGEVVSAEMKEPTCKVLSFHNQCEMENKLDDFQREVLKLRLVYECASCHDFNSTVDSLMGESVSFMEQYVKDFSILFDCVSHGHDMNSEDNLSEC